MSVPTNAGQTGTYNFSPAASDLIIYAYSLIGLRPPDLETQHYIDAGMAANMVMVDLSNRNPHQYTLETQSISLTQGTATYNLAQRTIAVSIVTISTTSGGVTIERTIGPISAYEYFAQPIKASQAPPTSYFFQLAATPTLTFWPTPDVDSTYTAKVQSFRQNQDVDLTSLYGVDAPYRFLDVLATGIAARLAQSYRPELASGLYQLLANRMTLALGRDQESVPLTILPNLSSYYRVY